MRSPAFQTTRSIVSMICCHGKPLYRAVSPDGYQQNGFIESFNGKPGDDCLNETLFGTLRDARKTREE